MKTLVELGIDLVPVGGILHRLDGQATLGNVAVDAVAVYGCHTNLLAVVVGPDIRNDLVALQIVRNDVLGARCWAGASGKLHGKSRQHQCLHNGACRLGIAACDVVCQCHDAANGLLGDGGNLVAVIFVDKNSCNMPVNKTYVLGHHVAKACRLELCGRGGQNLGVTDNDARLLGLPGGLEGILNDGRRIRGKAIHGGRCCKDAVVLFLAERGHAANVVEGACAHGDDTVTVGRKVFDLLHLLGAGVLHIVVNKLFDVEAVFLERRKEPLGNTKSVVISHKKNVLWEIRLGENIARPMNQAASDLNALRIKIMRSAAGTALKRIQYRLNIHDFPPYAFCVATTLASVPQTFSMRMSPITVFAGIFLALICFMQSKTSSRGMGLSVLTATTRPSSQAMVEVTVRTGWVHSLSA